MKSTKTFLLIALSVGLLLNCDDEVPWLEFPADLVSRPYKIGSVAIVEDPTDPQSILDAFEIIEGLSQGGDDDNAVVTVPSYVNWEAQVLQEHVDLIATLRRYDVEVNVLVDPLPHRYYLGGQDPPPPGSNFADPDVRQMFKQYTQNLVTQTSPDFIEIGIEVNMYYHGSGIEDFVHLNSLINETADLVRGISPQTRIATSFQYEHFLMFSETYGWEPLENFEWNTDFIGLSTFPLSVLISLDPSRLPPNYYTVILDHLPPNITPETLKLTFSEMCFPSMPEPAAGFDGSEKHQSNGVVTFIQLIAQFDHIEYVNYWYLHDDATFGKMTSFGLIESTSTPGGTPGENKPAYFIWEQLGQLPYIPESTQANQPINGL